MIVTIAATLCHMIAGVPDMDDEPEIEVCHEEVLTTVEDLQACIVSQAGVADWKMKSRFRDDEWTISRIRCIPGTYFKRDAL